MFTLSAHAASRGITDTQEMASCTSLTRTGCAGPFINSRELKIEKIIRGELVGNGQGYMSSYWSLSGNNLKGKKRLFLDKLRIQHDLRFSGKIYSNFQPVIHYDTFLN